MEIYKFKTMTGVNEEALYAAFQKLLHNEQMKYPSFDYDKYEWVIGCDVFARLRQTIDRYSYSDSDEIDKYLGIDLKVFSPGVMPTIISLSKKNSKGISPFKRYDDMISLSKTYDNMFKKDTPKKVIFNDPATIVYWKDGTKTVVKAEDEPFDPEKGLAMAIAKKYLGNKGNYYDIFRKWLPKEEDFSKYMNPPISEQYELLTVKQFSEKTGQPEVTIRRDCRKKLHPGAKKVDGKWMIPFSGIIGGNKNDK